MGITAVFAVITSYILWFFIFMTEYYTFWTRLLISVTILLVIALASKLGMILGELKIGLRTTLSGLAVGLGFYALTYLGYSLFEPYVSGGASAIYRLQSGEPLAVIGVLLIFTSIGEEVFWRGFILNEFRARCGAARAIIYSTLIYSTVHLWTLNPPLMFIALLAGLIWGLLYVYTRSLASSIASHIVWAELVFVLLPLLP